MEGAGGLRETVKARIKSVGGSCFSSETKTGSRDHIQQTTYWNPRVSVYDCYIDEIGNPQQKSSDSNSTMYWKE